MSGSRWKIAIAIGVVIAACAAAPAARAAFPDRDVELIVGYGPGGAYSNYALALAPLLERYLPPGHKVVVRYMPGGGGVRAAEYIQHARPDGTTIGIYNVFGLGGTQLVRPVNYDLTKITWLARVAVDNEVGLVAENSQIKTVADLRKPTKPQYILSTQGLGATGTISAAVLFQQMGVHWKPLNNSRLGPAALAVIRGDADMYFGTYGSTFDYINSKQLRPIVFFGPKLPVELPGIPIPSDLGYAGLDNFIPNRLIGGPPGMPTDVTKVLEAALAKGIQDPQYRETLAKNHLKVEYADAAETTKLALDTLQSYAKYRDTVRELFQQQ